MVIAVLCALFLPETDGQKIPKTVEEAEEFEKNYNPCTCECINWRQIRRPNTDEPHSDHLHSDELHSENSYSDKSDSGKHTLASPPTIMFGQL
nr:uncharacterized protein LOC107445888 [Parasteatoda tepidariorum]